MIDNLEGLPPEMKEEVAKFKAKLEAEFGERMMLVSGAVHDMASAIRDINTPKGDNGLVRAILSTQITRGMGALIHHAFSGEEIERLKSIPRRINEFMNELEARFPEVKKP